MRTETPWIDEESSKLLPILRARGEGQHLEFIQKFPDQAHELAKEIAAFATSNSGTVLLGVNDDGDCIGLADATTAGERDTLLRRVEGICNGTVKPAITPIATFAQEAGKTVLVLTVPKGSQPVYYSNGRPYLRHLTQSRPAEPHEVIELIRRAVAPAATDPDAEAIERRIQFLADIMRTLIPVRLFTEELDDRIIDPWLQIIRAQFEDISARLREAATVQLAVDEKLETDLLDAAEALKHFAKLRLHLGSGPDLQRAAGTAAEKTDYVLKRIAPEVIAYVGQTQLLEQLTDIKRQLALLKTQAEETEENGNVEDLQGQAAEAGRVLFFVAQYGVNRLAPDLRLTLTTIAHQLHLAETRRVYMDGGQSAKRIADDIKEAIAAFREATAQLLPS